MQRPPPTSTDERPNLLVFCSYHFTMADIDKFNEQRYFDCYDFYERYDPKTNYNCADEFQKDYGNGLKTYSHGCVEIQFYKGTSTNKAENVLYIVANRVLIPDELEMYKKHCQCQVCRTYWWNPIRLFMCSCCYGCIKSISPSQDVIKRTEKYIEKLN